ncbi:Tify [Macleaya cordata]|uniref:Protein TIFY n=1 Tax=Macleaya cordata TaxID=56857 RepID=A0A200Q172_MACCD|nr:Tify [Macleaya cordata]
MSMDFSEAGKLFIRESMRAQEMKSNFSQTCSLLSQYLKENGSFGDLNLGITRNLEGRTEAFRQTPITMNFTTPKMEMPAGNVSAVLGKNNASTASSSREIKSMDLFPQHAGFGPSPSSMDAVQKKADFSQAKEPETAQMTIFYAGKVIVFNDLPADKAKEVMLLASKSSPQNYSGSLFASTPANDRQISNNFTATVAANNSNNINELPPRPHQPIVSDLPIARKASLHRFLEKRKDRISSKAPYQITNNYSAQAATPKAPVKTTAESKTWLGLAPQSSQQLGFQ